MSSQHDILQTLNAAQLSGDIMVWNNVVDRAVDNAVESYNTQALRNLHQTLYAVVRDEEPRSEMEASNEHNGTNRPTLDALMITVIKQTIDQLRETEVLVATIIEEMATERD